MSEGFTPGDWYVSELEATGQKSEFYIFIEPGVAVIERSVTGEHDMNDARLLAAAPELLAALESAQMALMGYTHQNAITLAALFKARAAIAKARGTPC